MRDHFECLQMWISLSKLAALPDDTLVYCGHEYTMVSTFLGWIREILRGFFPKRIE